MFLVFFQPVLHSHSRLAEIQRCKESKDSHWERKTRGGRDYLPLSPGKGPKQEKKKKKGKKYSVYSEGVGTHIRALPSARAQLCTQLCSQMERMQGEGEGEVDHLERPSPLTDKERVMIQDSWAKVYENCDDNGVAILVRYSFFCFSYSFLSSRVLCLKSLTQVEHREVTKVYNYN